MMQTLRLDVGDMIQIKTTSLDLAKQVKLQPQSVNFLDISDPRAVLEKAFRNFAALTKGDVFNFEYNDEVYDVAVLDVKPDSPKKGVSMIETDVSVEFAPPVGYVEPSPAGAGATSSSARGSGTSTPRSGANLPAGGLLHSQGSMARDINYEAMANAAPITNFVGEGQRLSARKATGASNNNGKSSTAPAANAGSNADAPKRRAGGAVPLRLPPNKLFFGYEIKPVKTAADKEAEAEATRQPHFAGQGQTLRGALKKKDDVGKGNGGGGVDREKKKAAPDEGKGRRLDGRKV